MFRGSVKYTGYPVLSTVSPFTSPPVRHVVPSHFNWTLPLALTYKNSTSSHRLFISFVRVSEINIEVFPVQPSKTGIYSRVGKCSLCGTIWAFKYIILSFVLNWLRDVYGDAASPSGCVVLRRGTDASRFLGLRVRVPLSPGGMDTCLSALCCQVSMRDELITRLGESYRPLCLVLYDLKTSKLGKSWPTLVRTAIRKKKKKNILTFSVYVL